VNFEEDVIRTVIKTMKKNKGSCWVRKKCNLIWVRTDARIQKQCCIILSNVAVDVNQIQDIIDFHGLEQIKNTIETNADEDVLRVALHALQNIARSNDHLSQITPDLVECVLTALKKHEHPMVQQQGLFALANLAAEGIYS